MTPDNHDYPFSYPNGGFGIYCTRCHASAEKELTFSALNNIEGFPGEPLTFRVDDSWRNDNSGSSQHSVPADLAPPTPTTAPNPAFLQTFRSLGPIAADSVVPIPNVTRDHIIADGQMFVTSDQCQSCHSVSNPPFCQSMLAANKDGNHINFSEHPERRCLPMCLAG